MEETWTMGQILDPAFRNMLKENCSQLFGTVILELSDGKIRVSKRQAFMNLFWFPILTEFNIPLRKDHFVKRKPLNKGVLIKEWNRYYNEIMSMSVHNAKRLKRVIWDVSAELYDLGFNYMLEYVGTMDIIDMAEIMTDPVMSKELDTKYEITDDWSTVAVERFIEMERVKIMKLMGTPGALKNEVLLPYQRIKQLNQFQVPQTIYAFGVRTDVNDNIIRKPVIGSALDGLRDIAEFGIEALSAKKSAFYNKEAVRKSQYFGRKQHLLSSSVQHLYDGDCGSTQYVDFRITDDDPDDGKVGNYSNCIGKFILGDDNKLVLLTSDNIKQYVNRTVRMRSPMTCRYRNGVCEVCGGSVLANVNRKISIGILSAIFAVAPVTQKILSAKHLVKTNSLVYELDDNLGQLIECVNTVGFKWKKGVYSKMKNHCLGVHLKDFQGLHDVQLIRDNKEISEQKMSSIHELVFRGPDNCTHVYEVGGGKQTPFFSGEMLVHIRDNFDSVVIKDDIIWIPLKGTENITLFKTIVINDNMLEYVATVSGFLGGNTEKETGNISQKKTCAGALAAFSDIVYSKCSVNIVHLEVLLKSYLITSDTDYTIPIVEDANNVKFGSMQSILSYRFVGTKLAFEELSKYIKSPSTYTDPKPKSPFDIFVGFKAEK